MRCVADHEPHRDNNPEPGARPKVVVDVYVERLRRRALRSPVLDVYSADLHGRDLHMGAAVTSDDAALTALHVGTTEGRHSQRILLLKCCAAASMLDQPVFKDV